MSETVVDYVVRSGNGSWTVCRRTLDTQLSWLRSHEISRHLERENALAEMRARNSIQDEDSAERR